MGSPTTTADWLEQTERAVRREGGVLAAVLRRSFAVSREALWAACSDPRQLQRWFGGVEGEASEGNTVRLEIGAPHKVSSKIVRCEPPRGLVVTWWYEGLAPSHIDEIELRLRVLDGTTELELQHRSEHGTDPAGVGPGWEGWLYRLASLLDGEENPPALDELEARSVELWNAL